MKKIFVVIVAEESGKYHAFADAIQAGNNLVPFVERYNAKTVHLCETRKQAETLARYWNNGWKHENKWMFGDGPQF